MIWQRLLHWLYPPHCPGCRRRVPASGTWCPTCWGEIWHPRMIPGSRKAHLAGCYAVGDYRAGLREAIVSLKFRKQKHQIPFLVTLLESFPWQDRLGGDWLYVPIPISEERRRERGFDQTEEVFGEYCRRHGCRWRPLLRKVRHTQAQSGLPRHLRKDNIKGAFAMEDASLQGQRIVLVDDIFTTGYTMYEAARILHRAGAGEIVGWVLASGRG